MLDFGATTTSSCREIFVVIEAKQFRNIKDALSQANGYMVGVRRSANRQNYLDPLSTTKAMIIIMEKGTKAT